MDVNIIIGVCTVITTVGALMGFMGKRFDKIEVKLEKISLDLRQLDSRLSKVEGYIEKDLVSKYRSSPPTGSE